MEIERQRIADALPAYDIGDVLGRGGWGVVFAGRHRHLDRAVAIKQLPATFATDIAARRRFNAEARVLASLDHPHVVPVYDFVEREDLCLLVMELLPGGTLRERFATGFTAAEAVAVSMACAAGLNAAHQRGVLHRDVKPENMLFAASGAIKVTDFGIAKVVGGSETMLTRAGDVVGTPSYIAPEQVRGLKLSPATDVYALATMLYELLSGALPFTPDGDAMSVLFQHAYESPIPLGEVAGHVPAPVAAVVMRGLATDPGDRFPTAEAFGVALAEAATEAWQPGWLAVEGMPVLLGAERIVAPTRHTNIGTETPWTLRRARVDPGVTAAGDAVRDAAAPRSPAPVTIGPGSTPDADRGTADRGVPATVDAGEQEAGDTEPDDQEDTSVRRRRRPALTVAIVLVVVLAVIAALLLVPRIFTVYGG
jgi:predicted Ser/Thr protein kinase